MKTRKGKVARTHSRRTREHKLPRWKSHALPKSASAMAQSKTWRSAHGSWKVAGDTGQTDCLAQGFVHAPAGGQDHPDQGVHAFNMGQSAGEGKTARPGRLNQSAAGRDLSHALNSCAIRSCANSAGYRKTTWPQCAPSPNASPKWTASRPLSPRSPSRPLPKNDAIRLEKPGISRESRAYEAAFGPEC